MPIFDVAGRSLIYQYNKTVVMATFSDFVKSEPGNMEVAKLDSSFGNLASTSVTITATLDRIP